MTESRASDRPVTSTCPLRLGAASAIAPRREFISVVGSILGTILATIHQNRRPAPRPRHSRQSRPDSRVPPLRHRGPSAPAASHRRNPPSLFADRLLPARLLDSSPSRPAFARTPDARLRRHAQLEALHRRRGQSHRRPKIRARNRRLPRSAKFAHQRRTLSQRRHRVPNATGNAALPFTLDFVDEWHDQPLLAKAFAENLRAAWTKANAEYGGTLSDTLSGTLSGTLPIIFTAHSVPARTITEGDPYEAQSKETAQLVAKAAGLEDGRPPMDLRLPKPGHVRRPVDRADGRRNNSEPQSQRPPRSVHPPRRLPLRSRRSALRHRHLLQTVRRKRRPAPMASRIAERIEDVDGGAGGVGSQPCGEQ